MGLLNLPCFDLAATPLSTGALLDIYPVGTEDQRTVWEEDLRRMGDEAAAAEPAAKEVRVTESSTLRFKKIRKELRDAGLPLTEPNFITKNSVWKAIFGTGSSSQNVDELETRDLIRLAHSPYLNVPDVIVDQLVTRYRETIDPRIHETLLHLVNSDPLRLSSVLGLAFYLGVFEDVKEPAVRQRMISRLIGNGGVDGRIIPVIRKIGSVTPLDFIPDHMPALLGLLSRYPALLEPYTESLPRVTGIQREGMLHIFTKCPDTLPTLFENLFDDSGRLAKKPSLARQVLAAIPGTKQAAMLSRLLDTVGERNNANWKEYGMARFISKTGHLFPYRIDKVHVLAEQQGDGWRQYSTPILVDILIFLEEHPSYIASSSTSQLAQEIKQHLLSARRSDFSDYMEIFRQRPFDRSALLSALYSEMEENPATASP
ncbi:MAG: hypothetical protein WC690_01715 [bacterium]